MPYNQRPAELNDRAWLADHYATRSAAQIARELHINPQMVLAALRRQEIPVRSRVDALRRRNPDMHDIEALERRVAATSVVQVAAEIGVTVIAVQTALARHGGQSAHRYDGPTPMTPPPEDVLCRCREAEQTIKGVARRFDVSFDTAAVWLAQVRIFLNDAPRIGRTDLETAIHNRDSLHVISRRHHVTARSVVVDLIRHDLFEAHRLRHMPQR